MIEANPVWNSTEWWNEFVAEDDLTQSEPLFGSDYVDEAGGDMRFPTFMQMREMFARSREVMRVYSPVEQYQAVVDACAEPDGAMVVHDVYDSYSEKIDTVVQSDCQEMNDCVDQYFVPRVKEDKGFVFHVPSVRVEAKTEEGGTGAASRNVAVARVLFDYLLNAPVAGFSMHDTGRESACQMLQRFDDTKLVFDTKQYEAALGAYGLTPQALSVLFEILHMPLVYREIAVRLLRIPPDKYGHMSVVHGAIASVGRFFHAHSEHWIATSVRDENLTRRLLGMCHAFLYTRDHDWPLSLNSSRMCMVLQGMSVSPSTLRSAGWRLCGRCNRVVKVLAHTVRCDGVGTSIDPLLVEAGRHMLQRDLYCLARMMRKSSISATMYVGVESEQSKLASYGQLYSECDLQTVQSFADATERFLSSYAGDFRKRYLVRMYGTAGRVLSRRDG